MSKEAWCRAYVRATRRLGKDASEAEISALADQLYEDEEARKVDEAYDRVREQRLRVLRNDMRID